MQTLEVVLGGVVFNSEVWCECLHRPAGAVWQESTTAIAAASTIPDGAVNYLHILKFSSGKIASGSKTHAF